MGQRFGTLSFSSLSRRHI